MKTSLIILAIPLLVQGKEHVVRSGQERDIAAGLNRWRVIRQDTATQTGGAGNTATSRPVVTPTTPTTTAVPTTTEKPDDPVIPTTTTTTTTTPRDVPQTSATVPTTTTVQQAASSTVPSRTVSTKPVTSTNAEGEVVTYVESVFYSASGVAEPSASSTAAPKESEGMGTKSIIGLSVAGGLFLLGVLGFIYWKLTRKRFSDFEDDGGGIKWPDLNDNNASALQPIPARANTTGGDYASDSRPWSPTHSQRASMSNVHVPYHDNYSTTALSNVDLTRPPLDPSDPHAHAGAVPPYYDDPQYGGVAYNTGGRPQSGYYDPYRGPIPGSLDGHGSMEGGAAGRRSPGPNAMMYSEQRSMSPGPYGRSTSPGPNAAYGGRTSPGPNVAYGGRTSPGPAVAYGGRTSPGPGVAYGGRTSPGPNVAYGGRTSPGPNVAYGGRTSPGPAVAYGGRTSPGPNIAYGGRHSPGPNNL